LNRAADIDMRGDIMGVPGAGNFTQRQKPGTAPGRQGIDHDAFRAGMLGQ
jgi:hypothetical protein